MTVIEFLHTYAHTHTHTCTHAHTHTHRHTHTHTQTHTDTHTHTKHRKNCQGSRRILPEFDYFVTCFLVVLEQLLYF